MGILLLPRYFKLSACLWKVRYSSIGRPGSFTFSFLRGVYLDERYQKLARRGNEVMTVVMPLAAHLAWVIQERKLGTLTRRMRSATLENPSAPGPSAGSIPSLIEGDYTKLDRRSSALNSEAFWNYRYDFNTIVFSSSKSLRCRWRSSDEVKLILRLFGGWHFWCHGEGRQTATKSLGVMLREK